MATQAPSSSEPPKNKRAKTTGKRAPFHPFLACRGRVQRAGKEGKAGTAAGKGKSIGKLSLLVKESGLAVWVDSMCLVPNTQNYGTGGVDLIAEAAMQPAVVDLASSHGGHSGCFTGCSRRDDNPGAIEFIFDSCCLCTKRWLRGQMSWM
jgi:hypothetical protein